MENVVLPWSAVDGGLRFTAPHPHPRPRIRSTTDGSAESVVNDLKAQGYNVVINWLTGYNTKSLSVCWVSNINNPGQWDPPPGTFTTVYVDVSCPNHDYD